MNNMSRFVLLLCLAVASFGGASLLNGQKAPEAGDKEKDKALLEEVCGSCHDLEVVVNQHASKAGWQAIVDDMVARGATAPDEKIKRIVEYLAANYGREPAKINAGR